MGCTMKRYGRGSWAGRDVPPLWEPRWRLGAISALAVGLLVVLLQPAGVASAQGTVGGANLTLISCAASVPDPVCSPANGAAPNVANRDVAFLFDLGTAPGQIYQLVRVTVGDTADAATIVTPIQIGTLGLVRDSIPAAAGQVACYQLNALAGGVLAHSDFECVVLGQAQGTVPAETGIALDQSNNLTVTWQSISGAAQYLVYSFGTDGVQTVTGTSATLQGTGGLICAVVIPQTLQGQSLGSSNLECGFPNNFSLGIVPTPTGTRLSTSTAAPSATVTTAGTTTRTPTGTLPGTVTAGATGTASVSPTLAATAGSATPTPTASSLADLTVSVASHPGAANPGDVLTYTLTITNQGTAPANAITVQNNLSTGVSLLSFSATSGFACGQPVSSGVMACAGGSLAAGGSATIDLVVFVISPCTTASPFVDTAIVNPNRTVPESDFTNNTAWAQTSIAGCPLASPTSTGTPTPTGATTTPGATSSPSTTGAPGLDLTISGSSQPTSVAVDGSVTYTLVVSASGGAATNVAVLDTLPPGVSFLVATGTAGFSCDETSPGIVGCSGGAVNPTSPATITVFSQVTGCATPLTNVATVNPGHAIGEASFDNNTATMTTEVAGCPTVTPTLPVSATQTVTSTVTSTPSTDLSVVVSDSPDPISNPGGSTNNGDVTYTVVVSNTGTSQVSLVTVIDTLDNGSVFTCGAATVAPGDQCNTSDPNPNNSVAFITASGNDGFVCTSSSTGSPTVTDVVCTGGTIPPSGAGTITIVISSSSGCGFILNRALVDPTNVIGESNETNNVGYAQTACGAGSATPTTLATLTATRTPTVAPTRTVTPTSAP